jgi:hypothetical protein
MALLQQNLHMSSSSTNANLGDRGQILFQAASVHKEEDKCIQNFGGETEAKRPL